MNKSGSYYSTNNKAEPANFKEALLKGLAPDGGLYLPSVIKPLSERQLVSMASLDYPGIAHLVLSNLTENAIDNDELMNLCRNVYNFEVPLEQVSERIYILRLDRGPTASFKDFAARMMGRMMEYYLKKENTNVTILTATSGDTGSAIASAFHGLKNIRVIILYPVNEVTVFQRKQMTTLGKNISVLAVNGKFDDCQLLVKKAFMDPLLSALKLSSANSINIGRLLPQSVYYFWAWSRLSKSIEDATVFSVPSGNFGNLMGGLIARKMGLPVDHFIIATNANDEVPVYLQTGEYKVISPSRYCISSAMNVGHPGNMARVFALYGGMMDEKGHVVVQPDLERMRHDFHAFSISDDLTRKTMAEFYRDHGMVIEPHGAVAWAALKKYMSKQSRKSAGIKLYISLETAHPAKFREEILNTLGFKPEVPLSLRDIDKRSEEYLPIENDYDDFRALLMKEYLKQ